MVYRPQYEALYIAANYRDSPIQPIESNRDSMGIHLRCP